MPLHTHQDGFFPGKWKINVGKDAEKLESFYIVDGNVKWCGHCRKQSLKKLTVESSYDPGIPL